MGTVIRHCMHNLSHPHHVDVPITHIFINLSIYSLSLSSSGLPLHATLLLVIHSFTLMPLGWTEWLACWMKCQPRNMHTYCLANWPLFWVKPVELSQAERSRGRVCRGSVDAKLYVCWWFWVSYYSHTIVCVCPLWDWFTKMKACAVLLCWGDKLMQSKQTHSEWLCLLISASEPQNLHVSMKLTENLTALQTHEPDGLLCVCVSSYIRVRSHLCGCSSRWILKGECSASQSLVENILWIFSCL